MRRDFKWCILYLKWCFDIFYFRLKGRCGQCCVKEIKWPVGRQPAHFPELNQDTGSFRFWNLGLTWISVMQHKNRHAVCFKWYEVFVTSIMTNDHLPANQQLLRKACLTFSIFSYSISSLQCFLLLAQLQFELQNNQITPLCFENENALTGGQWCLLQVNIQRTA